MDTATDYGISKINRLNDCFCFVEGTPVLTALGIVAIETISAGDIVIATDIETGETAEKEVVEVYVNESSELVHLTINGEEITTTPAHPFYVPQKGWTSAIDLREGDILVLVNGEYVTVEAVQHEILESPVTVYNFQVADFHTYYVGEQSVLVHNQNNKNRCGIRSDAEQARQELVDSTPGGKEKAAVVAAYDVETGDIEPAFAGPIPENVNPILSERANEIGGLGSYGVTEGNTVGVCAEFRAGNALLNRGSSIENIEFTDTVRPRNNRVIDPCDNCKSIFSEFFDGEE